MLDANILVRAVLGRRVCEIVTAHAVTAALFAPEVADDGARRHLPAIVTKHDRSAQGDAALKFLGQLQGTVRPVPAEVYEAHQEEPLRRLAARDADDWPNLVLTPMPKCPIWTEDEDLFGAGVATRRPTGSRISSPKRRARPQTRFRR